ncbi:hypothetical protein EDB86DRAFT_3243167 [Lactarius hatsudake]|nr:hypothetical protein EDB86DRAFT_3243167 [Lactarius hatsudake]
MTEKGRNETQFWYLGTLAAFRHWERIVRSLHPRTKRDRRYVICPAAAQAEKKKQAPDSESQTKTQLSRDEHARGAWWPQGHLGAARFRGPSWDVSNRLRLGWMDCSSMLAPLLRPGQAGRWGCSWAPPTALIPEDGWVGAERAIVYLNEPVYRASSAGPGHTQKNTVRCLSNPGHTYYFLILPYDTSEKENHVRAPAFEWRRGDGPR